ncbi:MBL fold metallo-hydrolase [Williamsia deligens]|uniref:MBL fold metallo-hydrolase n=1 Tax=Williamsia deligens TaxID=321325 RepID=A0ABW3GA94_9NOCA|nr:MBL fold metallo-hydrolase [Williamsia deligens]MCP2196233.1 L-ascorbate metabolism protein UlaG, beta-lactamase superfamily [Williamsia deligens]
MDDGSATTITWWGHATTTVVDSGVRVLTDPVLTRGVAHLRRRRGPVPAADAARADVVLVSHLHSDHLHVRSLARVDPSAVVVLPRGARRAVPGLSVLRGRDIREMGVGDLVDIGPVRIRAVPADHDGRRHPLARARVDPLGFVVEGAARTYFAGDTDLFDGMAAAVGPCDVALLPVGGWGPGLGDGHMTAERAAIAAGLLRPRLAIPVHFGTLWPVGLGAVAPDEFLPPGGEFVRAAARLAPETTAVELLPGETRSVDAH